MKPEKQNAKPYWEMTTEELARATAEFDEELVIDKCGPLSPEDQKRWQRMKRKMGRPKKGAGVKVISVSVERNLLGRADRLAKKLRTTRAALIARGLEKVLAAHQPNRRKTGT
jgi:hypothetical protein